MPTRRDFLGALFGASATIPALKNDGLQRIFSTVSAAGNRSAEAMAEDEDFWFEIRNAFTLDANIMNLNNGGVCPSPRVVLQAMERYLNLSNEAPAYTMWRLLEPEVENVRKGLAATFGCDPEELAITRNASEALEIAQLGQTLSPGDEVLTTDQDYPRMLTTWEQRVRRDGIVLTKVSFSDPPPSQDYLVQMFERAITPKTRVIHFCHITNLSGQIFPVKAICEMARAKGITTIVDGAHAFAHFPFTYADLQCDYYGTSLHKWLLAPIGTGFLFARRELIGKTWPMMAAGKNQDDDIRKFEEIGTHPAANHDAIAEALAFHHGIGAQRKAARLRYLRNRWMKRLDGKPGVTMHTSYDPAQSCGIANIGIKGIDPGKLTGYLWNEHRILVTPIGHPACTGIRVTPNVYTLTNQIDRFGDVMEGIIAKGSLG